jgi:hypothetical protein
VRAATTNSKEIGWWEMLLKEQSCQHEFCLNLLKGNLVDFLKTASDRRCTKVHMGLPTYS